MALKLRFPRSRLYIGANPQLVIGWVVGLLTAFLGVGGGFVMVPALIYLLRMPTNVVIGTSTFQIIFVTAVVTVLQATFNHSLDVVLALILASGGVIGGQSAYAPDRNSGPSGSGHAGPHGARGRAPAFVRPRC